MSIGLNKVLRMVTKKIQKIQKSKNNNVYETRRYKRKILQCTKKDRTKPHKDQWSLLKLMWLERAGVHICDVSI